MTSNGVLASTLDVAVGGTTNLTGGSVAGAVTSCGTLNTGSTTLSSSLTVSNGTTTVTGCSVAGLTTVNSVGALQANTTFANLDVTGAGASANLTGGTATNVDVQAGSLISVANITGTLLANGIVTINPGGIVGRYSPGRRSVF